MSIKKEPTDLIPAWQASQLVCASARCLSRWAAQGKLREFRREGFKARFYSRTELTKFIPKQVGS